METRETSRVESRHPAGVSCPSPSGRQEKTSTQSPVALGSPPMRKPHCGCQDWQLPPQTGASPMPTGPQPKEAARSREEVVNSPTEDRLEDAPMHCCHGVHRECPARTLKAAKVAQKWLSEIFSASNFKTTTAIKPLKTLTIFNGASGRT